MKILENIVNVIVVALCLGVAGESWAACVNNQTCGVQGHENDCCWSVEGGVLTISGNGEMRDFSRGQPWNSIRNSITSIEIKNGIVNVGASAFSNMNNLTKVKLPDSITSIGDSGFWNTPKVNDFTIPDSLTSIGNYALGGGKPDMNGSFIIPDSVTGIAYYALNSWSNLKSLVIGNSMKNILRAQFHGISGTIFCPQGLNCNDKEQTGETLYYTKDENGVYKVGDVYYASAEDMANVDGDVLVPIACKSYEACVQAAAAYKEEKAEKLAQNGILCQTKLGCLKLLNMLTDNEYQCDETGKHINSIANCSSYAKANGIALNICPGEQVYYKHECLDEYPFAKKKYTPAEAAQWLNEDNNTVTLTFKKQ